MPAIGLDCNCCGGNTTIEPPDFHPLASINQKSNQIKQLYSIDENCEMKSDVEILMYYLVFAILFGFAWATIQVSHLAMIPEITSDEQEQMALASFRNAATVISSLSTYLIFLLLVKTGNFMQNYTPI